MVSVSSSDLDKARRALDALMAELLSLSREQNKMNYGLAHTHIERAVERCGEALGALERAGQLRLPVEDVQ